MRKLRVQESDTKGPPPCPICQNPGLLGQVFLSPNELTEWLSGRKHTVNPSLEQCSPPMLTSHFSKPGFFSPQDLFFSFLQSRADSPSSGMWPSQGLFCLCSCDIRVNFWRRLVLVQLASSCFFSLSIQCLPPGSQDRGCLFLISVLLSLPRSLPWCPLIIIPSCSFEKDHLSIHRLTHLVFTSEWHRHEEAECGQRGQVTCPRRHCRQVALLEVKSRFSHASSHAWLTGQGHFCGLPMPLASASGVQRLRLGDQQIGIEAWLCHLLAQSHRACSQSF